MIPMGSCVGLSTVAGIGDAPLGGRVGSEIGGGEAEESFQVWPSLVFAPMTVHAEGSSSEIYVSD